MDLPFIQPGVTASGEALVLFQGRADGQINGLDFKHVKLEMPFRRPGRGVEQQQAL